MSWPSPVILVSAALVLLGLRLLARGVRGRTLPEALLGAGFVLGSCGVAFVAEVNAGTLDPSLGLPLAHVVVNAGLSLFVVFCQRVFRPGVPWARAAAALAIAALAGSALAFGRANDASSGTLEALLIVTRLVPFGWLGFETALHHRRLRRRQELGLGDPVLANRFLLWSIWNGCLLALPVAALVLLALGLSPDRSPVFLAVASPFGAVAAVALWLSFFPPAAYRRWLRAGATPVAG